MTVTYMRVEHRVAPNIDLASSRTIRVDEHQHLISGERARHYRFEFYTSLEREHRQGGQNSGGLLVICGELLLVSSYCSASLWSRASLFRIN